MVLFNPRYKEKSTILVEIHTLIKFSCFEYHAVFECYVLKIVIKNVKIIYKERCLLNIAVFENVFQFYLQKIVIKNTKYP